MVPDHVLEPETKIRLTFRTTKIGPFRLRGKRKVHQRQQCGFRYDVQIHKNLEKRPALSEDSRRSEEHTSELQSRFDLVCRLLLEKKKNKKKVLEYYNIT